MRFSLLPMQSTQSGILVRQIMSGIMDTKILERVSDCEELVGFTNRRLCGGFGG